MTDEFIKYCLNQAPAGGRLRTALIQTGYFPEPYTRRCPRAARAWWDSDLPPGLREMVAKIFHSIPSLVTDVQLRVFLEFLLEPALQEGQFPN